MPEKKHTALMLNGEVSVAYRKAGRRWYCNALQFDIVGVGSTKTEAFKELQSLVEDYLEEVLASDEPVAFFNPASAEEWNEKDQESYHVTVILAESAMNRAKLALSDLSPLRKYRKSIKSIYLTPTLA